jgi:hypothetical protein
MTMYYAVAIERRLGKKEHAEARVTLERKKPISLCDLVMRSLW